MDIFMYRSISFNQFTYCTLWQLKRKPVKYCACKMLNIVPRLCGDYLNLKCIESPNKRMWLFWGESECLCKICLLSAKKMKPIKFRVIINLHYTKADVSLKIGRKVKISVEAYLPLNNFFFTDLDTDFW